MKKQLILLCTTAIVCGCGSNKSGFEGDLVAEKVTIDGVEVVSADVNAFNTTVTIPLSELAGPLEIVRLETRDEALFSYGKTYITDNYIGISTTGRPVTFKLFDRKGKYLRDIGHEGRGPNEYGNIYSAAIDEASQTIYIMPWSASELLAFGLDGSFKDPVPLAHRVGKAVFRLEPDGNITVAGVPIRGSSPSWVWTQDRQGNVIHEVAAPAGRQMDFGSEIAADRNTGEFDPFILMFNNTENDYLGNYDAKTGKMTPVFTIHNIQSSKAPYYSYSQLPGYFIGQYSGATVSTVSAEGERTMSHVGPTEPVNFIVDKKTLQGAQYKVVIDELGGLDAGYSFYQGFYMGNWPAIYFKGRLEDLIDSGTIEDPDVLKRVTELAESTNEEGNNVIMLAKLKK